MSMKLNIINLFTKWVSTIDFKFNHLTQKAECHLAWGRVVTNRRVS